MAGRRRLVPNLTSRNFQMRAQAEREAVNMPIQGTAADILKKAMIDLHAELPRRGLKTRMILTVHDELLFECPRDEADAAAAVVRERMENAVTLSVPLTVDVGIARKLARRQAYEAKAVLLPAAALHRCPIPPASPPSPPVARAQDACGRAQG